MLHLLWSIIVGFIVGLIASAIMHTHMGFLGTTLLGIIGSVVGGLLARLFSPPAEGSSFHPRDFSCRLWALSSLCCWFALSGVSLSFHVGGQGRRVAPLDGFAAVPLSRLQTAQR